MEHNYIIGTDFDGVLCKNHEIVHDKWNTMNKEKREKYKKDLKENLIKAIPYYKNLELFREKMFVIITARHEDMKKITDDWCSKQELKPMAIYYMQKGNTLDNMIEHKINTILEHNIKVFYEDNPKIVKQLRKNCPDCTVVEVTNETYCY